MKLNGLLLLLGIFVSMFSTMNAQTFDSQIERELPPFTKIKSGSVVEIILVKGNKSSAKIRAKNVDLAEIITEVKNGELSISLEKYKLNPKVQIELSVQTIESIRLAGAGSLKGADELSGEKLDLAVSGAGNITLDAKYKTIHAMISGAGSIQLEGEVNRQEVMISGAGSYKAFDLSSESAEVKISGAGNANIEVAKELVAKISGAGNLKYKGDPSTVDVSKTGAGSVKRME